MDKEVLAQLEADIHYQQERLARLPGLQADIADAKAELEIMRGVGPAPLVKSLEERITQLTALYQKEQEQATRHIAEAEALKAQALEQRTA